MHHPLRRAGAALWILVALAALAACGAPAAPSGKKTIVVTYAILGSVVRELVGDAALVIVPMPNGQDPHDWEPSAKDIEAITKANLIVQNGLGLEGGMEKALGQAKEAGVRFFTASEHISIRKVGPGEGLPTGDSDQAVGADDPHLWMDPLAMKSVVAALATQLKADLGIDLGDRATRLEAQLDALNAEIAADLARLPEANRQLITGHESLGYFAQRYGLKLVGAIIPSLTTQAEVSAADLASLKQLIAQSHVRAVFTEIGTPPQVAQTISQEMGVKVVALATHSLPDDGSYATFMRNLAGVVVGGLS